MILGGVCGMEDGGVSVAEAHGNGERDSGCNGCRYVGKNVCFFFFFFFNDTGTTEIYTV